MMHRTIFASDLDNTLLVSRKHARKTDLCVEYLDGTPQGYLPEGAPQALARVMQRALFIPVTSRSVAQYRRIHFPDGCCPRYAVTTNGAILLVDGEIDRLWYQESRDSVLPWKEALEEVLRAMDAQPQARRYRMVDGMFAFAACDTPQDALALEAALCRATPLDIAVTGRKVYCFPPQINKGTVIPKLRRYFQAREIICAGDSSMDVPMLRQADFSIVPDGMLMAGGACSSQSVCKPEERFCDFVLREVLRRIG